MPLKTDGSTSTFPPERSSSHPTLADGAQAVLVCLAQGDDREHPLGELTTIGRDETNDLVLHDPSVSRRHARIQREADGAFRLTDLGSTQGTLVGGERVQDARLSGATVLWFGGVGVRFELRGSPRPPRRAGASCRQAATPSRQATVPAPSRRLTLVGEPTFFPASDIAEMDELRRQYEKLRAAFELTRLIGVEHAIEPLLERIVGAVLEITHADFGAIVLMGRGAKPDLRVAKSRNGMEGVALPRCIMEEVVANRAAVLTDDASLDRRFRRSESVLRGGLRAVISAPLLYQDEVLGILHLDWRAAGRLVDDRDVDLVSTIALQAALAVKNALLVDDLRRAKDSEWRRLEQAVSDLPVGLVLLDSERRILVTNPLGDRFLSQAAGGQSGEVLERIGSVEASELLPSAERGGVEVLVPGPPRRLFAISAARAEGESSGTVLVTRDITEERERETEALRQARLALVGRLAGGVSHDLNNILTVIASCASFLTAESATASQRADASEILDQTQRAAALTRQLLAFSRQEASQPVVLDLNEVVRGVERLLRRTLSSQMELEVRLAAESLWTRADPARIEQVLLNLVVNARDAMAGGGTVTIETSHGPGPPGRPGPRDDPGAGPCATLKVRDTGEGMDPEVMARVFEPFFTTKENGKGTGLGLATVREIVQGAGGTIGVTSKPGHGTTFEIHLPSTDCPRHASPEAAPSAPTGGTETLLLTEDNESLRKLTARLLRSAGYTVLESRSGEEAARLLDGSGRPPDLALIDIGLPGLSGLELADRLERHAPGAPVLLTAGYLSPRHAAAVGERPFLQKPFTPTVLLRRIRELLDRGRAQGPRRVVVTGAGSRPGAGGSGAADGASGLVPGSWLTTPAR